jgi:hypothetical protein
MIYRGEGLVFVSDWVVLFLYGVWVREMSLSGGWQVKKGVGEKVTMSV